MLDAPALADDFYLNLVDWSSQNVLAVGLGSCVYLWSAASSAVRAAVGGGGGRRGRAGERGRYGQGRTGSWGLPKAQEGSVCRRGFERLAPAGLEGRAVQGAAACNCRCWGSVNGAKLPVP